MYFDIERLHKQVADVFDEVAAFRRDIHMHPELSEHEARTETKICDWLNALDIPYEKGIAGHGICATICGQRTDKTAAIRADIDALPVTEQTGLPYASQNEGVMHACGHDMHTSILLGVAKILKANQVSLPGTVRLLFQPSEETIGGARQMIEVGCLQAVSYTHLDVYKRQVCGCRQAGVYARLHECGLHDVYRHRQRQILSRCQSLRRH